MTNAAVFTNDICGWLLHCKSFLVMFAGYFRQYRRLSGLFLRWCSAGPPSRDIAAQCPAGQWMNSASEVPIGLLTSEGRCHCRSVLALG